LHEQYRIRRLSVTTRTTSFFHHRRNIFDRPTFVLGLLVDIDINIVDDTRPVLIVPYLLTHASLRIFVPPAHQEPQNQVFFAVIGAIVIIVWGAVVSNNNNIVIIIFYLLYLFFSFLAVFTDSFSKIFSHLSVLFRDKI
jgi:hypothetical protein